MMEPFVKCIAINLIFNFFRQHNSVSYQEVGEEATRLVSYREGGEEATRLVSYRERERRQLG